MGTQTPAEGIRARARRGITAEIKAEARRHLAEAGADALSLRAITRALRMSSSAIYRYFDSRDALLTALIVDAYNDLGAAAEDALDGGAAPGDDGPAPAGGTAARDNRAGGPACPAGVDPRDRFRTVCRAVRDWALAHRHEYALLYGTPVPGYAAPHETIAPAARVGRALASLVAEAHRRGQLTVPAAPSSPQLRADAERLVADLPADVPADSVPMLIAAWAGLFGLISFELFGQFENGITARDEFFDRAVDALANQAGFAP